MSAEMSSWIADAETVAISNSTSSPSSSPSRIRAPGPQRAGSMIGKKRKPRPRTSKRVPTTYINADPDNFRAMVQQVTGIRFGEASRVGDGPDPQRRSLLQFQQQQSFLPPVLDASGFLARNESGGEFDFESMLSFPTLDSWGVI